MSVWFFGDLILLLSILINNLSINLRFVQIVKPAAVHWLTVFELKFIQSIDRSTFHQGWNTLIIVRINLEFVLAVLQIVSAYQWLDVAICAIWLAAPVFTLCLYNYVLPVFYVALKDLSELTANVHFVFLVYLECVLVLNLLHEIFN